MDSVKIEATKKIVAYDPKTGTFTRIASTMRSNGRPSNRSVGRVCNNKTKGGYVVVQACGKLYLAHRLAFALMGQPIPRIVDHINGDKSDNRWENLRPANYSLNGLNRHKKIGASQDLPIGVFRMKDKHTGKVLYRASVEFCGTYKRTKRKNLEDAIEYAEKWRAHFIEEAKMRGALVASAV